MAETTLKNKVILRCNKSYFMYIYVCINIQRSNEVYFLRVSKCRGERCYLFYRLRFGQDFYRKYKRFHLQSSVVLTLMGFPSSKR